MDSNSDEEGSSDDKSNSDEDLDNSDENLNNEGEMEQDVPPVPLYTMASGCSATLAGNAPIDYFSLFMDEHMLQHIVEQTILNSKQFMESHTLGQLQDPTVVEGGTHHRRTEKVPCPDHYVNCTISAD